MEEEDDDLYGPSETVAPAKQEKKEEESDGENGDAAMHESEESDEEESESESDLEIIIDKPQVAPKLPPQQESKAIKIEAPSQQQPPSAKPTSTQTATAGTAAHPTVPSIPGTAYPAVRSSTIDVNADPVYPPVGKPISQIIDLDADLAESTKPWRLPGADQSDYFNYGFDEFTWVGYCEKQKIMAEARETMSNETAQLQSMFGGMIPGMVGMPGMPGPTGPSADGGAGAGAGANVGVPGAPTGPAAAAGGMGGMPQMPPEMVQNLAMMAGVPAPMVQSELDQMQAQGADFVNMDLPSFIARVQARAGGGMGGGYGGPQGGYGGQGGRGGGGRRGRW
ncbi:Fip1-domain-containing protein [Westerdykella ornata]|uniref:Fip1-domain-containing protein n=1 Tax=Westerdykella ornata TaxID=318751 RepID=A0A6A6JBY5_WESOR|nr:Fip1-domain-containing protein [Westerdykella ornata]KAF2273508.1 Fip1-domain-containing protein [Westerdykella ornata]